MRNLHRTFVAALVAATALAVAACAPVRVNASLERGMDFTHYKSYAWAPGDKFSTGDPRLDNNEFFENRLKATSEKVLALHGFEYDTSDLLSRSGRFENTMQPVQHVLDDGFFLDHLIGHEVPEFIRIRNMYHVQSLPHKA